MRKEPVWPSNRATGTMPRAAFARMIGIPFKASRAARLAPLPGRFPAIRDRETLGRIPSRREGATKVGPSHQKTVQIVALGDHSLRREHQRIVRRRHSPLPPTPRQTGFDQRSCEDRVGALAEL